MLVGCRDKSVPGHSLRVLCRIIERRQIPEDHGLRWHCPFSFLPPPPLQLPPLRYVGCQEPWAIFFNELPILPDDSYFLIPASTCYPKPHPEPARLSRASQSSGKAFTLDSLRARGIIFTQVEAVDNITTPFLTWATVAGFSKTLSNPLFVLGHRLPVRLVSRC